MASLTPAFTLQLNNRILPGLATVGKFNGRDPSLTCATSGGKVFMHSPHGLNSETEDGMDEVKFLNVNRTITTLCAGPLGVGSDKHQLFIGTATNLLCYDVDTNADVFYRDVADGVGHAVYGRVPAQDRPLVIVGGNCSIQGFDIEGNEQFWTVTGGNIAAMCFCDLAGNGVPRLLVGSDDYEIRSFHNEEVQSEITETDKVTALCNVSGSRYGYALANGTVGLYDGETRAWRIKSKNMVTSIDAFDLDKDGVPELVVGWSNGRVEARHDRTGKVMFKDTLPASISKVLQADYRLDGREEVICCAADGEVRGYLPVDQGASSQLGGVGGGGSLGGGANAVGALGGTGGGGSANGAQGAHGGVGGHEGGFGELLQRKQELLVELNGLEANVKQIKGGDMGAGMIDPNTRVKLEMRTNHAMHCIELVVSTNNDSVVKAALVFDFDGGLFDDECRMVHPANASTEAFIRLQPPRDTPVELKVHALVGARCNSVQYHVFELVQALPKFSMHVLAPAGMVTEPQSSVTFYVADRASRFAIWINKNFNVQNSIQASQNRLSVSLVSLRDGSTIGLHMTAENGGKVVFQCDNMKMASELVQDLSSFLQITELESTAEFPLEMAAFGDVLRRVDDSNAIRLKLTAEMADSSHMVKTLVIKAEDARIRGDIGVMKGFYAELLNVNNELVGEYVKRANNHQLLLTALKEVNGMIQKAARLRVGKAKARVVALCREAIKSNNTQSLYQIISQGR